MKATTDGVYYLFDQVVRVVNTQLVAYMTELERDHDFHTLSAALAILGVLESISFPADRLEENIGRFEDLVKACGDPVIKARLSGIVRRLEAIRAEFAETNRWPRTTADLDQRDRFLV